VQKWRHYLTAAAGMGVMTAVVTFTGAGPALSAPVKDVLSFITNDAANAVPVRSTDDGAKDVFAEEVKLGWGQGTHDCSPPIEVPVGKRLVVEYVSVQANLVGNDQLVNMNIRGGGFGDNRIFAVIPPGFGGQSVATYYHGSQPMRLYLESTFKMCGVKTQATAPSFFSAMIWGYWVDKL
jgi:hypothetical protein